MGNKYCAWTNVSLYKSMDIDKYKKILKQNTERLNEATLSIAEKYAYICHSYRLKCLFDIDNLEIIVRLALGGAMTCIQMTCFLQLLGYNVNFEYVKAKLIELKNSNYIGVYTITDVETLQETDALYLMDDGLFVANKLGVPIVKGAAICRMKDKKSRIRKIKLFIEINGIILNQLVFNKNEVKSYLINDVYKITNKIKPVLTMEISDNKYIFWHYYKDEHNLSDLKNMLLDWECISSKTEGVVPIIICDSLKQSVDLYENIQSLSCNKKFFITITHLITDDKQIQIFSYDKVGNNIKRLQLIGL